jgi:diguanylate cyclase (GGDEF)-like protein
MHPPGRHVLLFALVLVALTTGAVLIARWSVDALMQRDAAAAGQIWARSIAANVLDLEAVANGAPLSESSRRFLERAQTIGHVFRFRIFDATGRERLVADGGDIVMAGSERLAKHNPAAARALASGQPVVFAKEGQPPQRPLYYAEAYVPVVVDGRTVAVVEAYVDQTEQYRDFRAIFMRTAAALSVLALLAFGIPAAALYARTKEKQRADEQIRFLAGHDALTRLPNRNRLIQALQREIEALPLGRMLALHHIDLDRLKDINDTAGHEAGNRLIQTIAERLRALPGEDRLIAHLGGDEFAVLQLKLTETAEAEAFAHTIKDALDAPVTLHGHDLAVRTTIGVALAPRDGRDGPSVMRCADIALYRGKAEGGDGIRMFTPEMDAMLKERLRLEQQLRRAIAENTLELHFQPLVRLQDERLVGFEALLRMKGADGRYVPPATFIPLAEDLGLIGAIGRWVINESCKAAATWPGHLTVAVNLSPAQFNDGRISTVVGEALAASGLDPRRLELEITESLLLSDTAAVMAELVRLRARGVAIVMDDFGTGYSSLSYLWRFPFEKLKLDGAFMRAFDAGDGQVEKIINTVIGMGHSLNMKITAEGVETERQAAFLRACGCDLAQGYYFGRPVPMTEVVAEVMADFRRSLPQLPRQDRRHG